jgi:hypothetical protein
LSFGGPGIGARRLGFNPQHLGGRRRSEKIHARHRHRTGGKRDATCCNGHYSDHGRTHR